MRVGVVGVGGHSSNSLLPNLAQAGMTLVATCARHYENAEHAARVWGAAHSFDSVEKMLASVELDGVIICVPPSDYAPLIQRCLEAGKPVFCDKPGAGSSAEAHSLAAAAEEKETPIVVGYMKRFAPAYRRARDIIRNPDFGQVSIGHFTFAMGPGGFGGDLKTYLLDNPVHHLDVARYLVGELVDIEAYLTELPEFGHAVAAIARSTAGAACTFTFCTTASWRQRNEHLEIFGRGHSVVVDNVDTCIYRPPERPEMAWRPNYTVPSVENSGSVTWGFVPELEHFRLVARGEVANTSDMSSAAATLELAERLCEICGV